MLRALIILAFTSGIAINSIAGTLTCDNTKVKQIAYHGNNKLMVQLENMNAPVFFCSPESDWSVSGANYTMGPETCKAVFSMFLSAKATGATISRVLFDGDAVPENCNDWGRWKSAVIRYVNY